MITSRMRGGRVHGMHTRVHGRVLRHGAVGGVMSRCEIHRCRVVHVPPGWGRHDMR